MKPFKIGTKVEHIKSGIFGVVKRTSSYCTTVEKTHEPKKQGMNGWTHPVFITPNVNLRLSE